MRPQGLAFVGRLDVLHRGYAATLKKEFGAYGYMIYIYMINNTYMILCHDDLIYINDGFELFSMSLTSWYVRVDSETNTFTGQSMAIIWKSFGEYLLIN